MRPIRLELEGFTAYRELTVCDFEGVDLFVLTGPTVSGKSSLIDALTFALYGTSPATGTPTWGIPSSARGSWRRKCDSTSRSKGASTPPSDSCVEREAAPPLEKRGSNPTDWELLFRRGEGFLSTELLRDEREETRFFTIDRWDSREARDRFRLRFARSTRCSIGGARYTLEETPVGDFSLPGPAR